MPPTQGVVHPEPKLVRAAAALDAGRTPEAEALLMELTQGTQTDAGALAMLAELRQTQSRHAEACNLYRAALRLQPRHYGALCNLGILESEAGHFDTCETLLRAAIATEPSRPNAYINLGIALEVAGRHTEALVLYRTALTVQPGNALGYFNLGNANLALGRLDAAIDSWRDTLACDPGFGDAHWNLAQALILRGDFAAGWQALEQRWRSSAFAGFLPAWAQPHLQWQGEDLNGKTILLWGEQGFGDQIQFARFATAVAKRGGVVTLAVRRPLQALCASIEGVSTCVELDQAPPAFDVHCALFDLPHRLGITRESIPAAAYLRAPDAKVRDWATRMPPARRLRVGLIWSSGMALHNPQLLKGSAIRSVERDVFAPLWQMHADFFCLQVDAPDAAAATPMIDWSGELHDFADTAALMCNLDLVISVDTAGAHLAGALGLPVWILLRQPPDWRWGEGASASATSTPWYASAHLFRQRSAGDWRAPVADVTQALAGLIAGRALA